MLSAIFLALSVASAAEGADTDDAPSKDGVTPSGSCAASEGCSDISPWGVSADAVFLQRAALDRSILLQPSGAQGTAASAANASDFKFNYQPGVDVDVVRNLFSDSSALDAIDFRYLGVNGIDDSFQTFLPTGDNVPFKAFQPFGNGAPQNWNLAYKSDIQSMEINAHYDLPSYLTLLVGARWLELDEHLLMDANVPSIPQTANFEFGTKNDLVGLQLGLRANSGSDLGRWRLDGSLKAGVYDDFARNSFGVAVNGTNNVFHAADSADQVAFIGEMQLKLQFLFSKHLTGEIGYQTLWVDGVAIAGNQVSATDITTHSGISTSGHAFYQGAIAGLNLRF
jgi:hypothetical protein